MMHLLSQIALSVFAGGTMPVPYRDIVLPWGYVAWYGVWLACTFAATEIIAKAVGARLCCAEARQWKLFWPVFFVACTLGLGLMLFRQSRYDVQVGPLLLASTIFVALYIFVRFVYPAMTKGDRS
jgi:hypothetical protein